MSPSWKLLITLLITLLNKVLAELDCPGDEPPPK